MMLLVQKFGGTSMGSLERIANVADKIIKAREAGHQVAVVVSAMSGETDRLIALAQAIQAEPDPREYSMLVSTGEQVSMSLLAMMLHSKGVPARSYTGNQAGIHTNSVYKKARILNLDCKRIQKDLAEGRVPIIAGFQGVDSCGEVTTLGRGGSDTSAVAVAAAIQADECQIFTDVEGVYTTDPRVVSTARLLEKVTFEEMLELASLGAKVLQIRSVEFAGKHNIPVRVLSSFVEGNGTLITFEENVGLEQPKVSGIAFNRSEAKITVRGIPDSPGVAARILGPISRAQIEVDMIIQNVPVAGIIDFTFTVHRDDFAKTVEIVEEIARELGASEILKDKKIAKLSLVGVGMRSHAGIASTMFTALGTEGINIQLISTSEIKISVVVDEKYLELGVRTLHSVFHLDQQEVREEWDPHPL
ncbi:MAG: aspartate kinase [Gammaproteobacteria bacterium]|nr:aspartate kinase [Gammaproteobacteria bacterium]